MPGFFDTFGGSFRSAAEGADTISWLASTVPRPEPNGGFFRDREPELEHMWLGGTSYAQRREDDLYRWLRSL